MSIGSPIKKLRHEHDMTQERLAEFLNMTPAAISAWECDRNSPDISQIPLLSHILIHGIILKCQEKKDTHLSLQIPIMITQFVRYGLTMMEKIKFNVASEILHIQDLISLEAK